MGDLQPPEPGHFDLPNRFFGSPNFGRIFSALNAREMQFGLRYAF